MSFSGKFLAQAHKGGLRIKNMALFRRPATKRNNSRNLIKRYFRLIR